MQFTQIVAALGLFAAGALALDKPLDIQVVSSSPCDRKTKVGGSISDSSIWWLFAIGTLTSSAVGDKIDMHYRGTLEDGTEFDASYNRGQVRSPCPPHPRTTAY